MSTLEIVATPTDNIFGLFLFVVLPKHKDLPVQERIRVLCRQHKELIFLPSVGPVAFEPLEVCERTLSLHDPL
jgi:hypothetical protein